MNRLQSSPIQQLCTVGTIDLLHTLYLIVPMCTCCIDVDTSQYFLTKTFKTI